MYTQQSAYINTSSNAMNDPHHHHHHHHDESSMMTPQVQMAPSYPGNMGGQPGMVQPAMNGYQITKDQQQD